MLEKNKHAKKQTVSTIVANNQFVDWELKHSVAHAPFGLGTSLTFLSSLSECVPLSPTLQPLIVLILPEEPELDVLRLLMGLEAGAIDIDGPEHNIGEEISLLSGLCLTKSFFILSKGVGFFILLFISVCICSYFCLISIS